MMDEPAELLRLRAELETELVTNILPYWTSRTIDDERGGFVGAIAADDQLVPDAPKGSILNARILWTFSAAYRQLGSDEYRATAERSFEYIIDHFFDAERGGVFWMVDAGGKPLDDRKHVYAQAFAIYALAEYYRATGLRKSLDAASELFRLVERHAHDEKEGGYHEAFDRHWQLLEDVRLSEKDAHERKSMNTHLHILEAYTNLYRAWPDDMLAARLRELVELFLSTIIDTSTGHLVLFFDDGWTPKSDERSFGHDIEASWLLLEAADVLGNPALRERVKEASLRTAEAVLAAGVDSDGGILNEGGPDGIVDDDKDWWPQAEAVVGFLTAYLESGEERYVDAAVGAWDFASRCMIDREAGEWHVKTRRDGVPYRVEEKVGPWKCPYHNGRACLEVMERIDAHEVVHVPHRSGG